MTKPMVVRIIAELYTTAEVEAWLQHAIEPTKCKADVKRNRKLYMREWRRKRNLSRPQSTPHGASGSAAISQGAGASQIGA